MIGLENKNLEEDRNLILELAKHVLEHSKFLPGYLRKKYEKAISSNYSRGICELVHFELDVSFGRLIKLWNGEYKIKKSREELINDLKESIDEFKENYG